MPEKECEIINRLGLHARAAAQFVQLASQFKAEVFVQKDDFEVNGKSIMGILMLAAPKGTRIQVRTEGPQADEALAALETLIRERFGED
ncbi:HPr family phosphocarrier protein [Desulfuromonas thiophila]|uniref:Phosphocarrier protein n=1 Tax=Desulfuromonas thiophila TaxID=57664 RepID=A0A1G7AQG0_9BACT|nr:HPr family phosphocarrier protein [Desulfuromonas thiophila]MCK9172244.1 HPr family phosphocarrier protein [Desulfuromonas thiophila]MDD3800800.1 HPr family phosphocarrier protein [Desulfuromonas thiophila]MDY0398525.1 HPr family phosphocarrier protein [Desulfuromonas thiophila]SDE17033.1 phosphocarrier protein [Desulfuromonas thiophila]